MNDDDRKLIRVVYLFGAGASHACAKSVGSAHGILMRDLSEAIADRVRLVVEEDFHGNESLRQLANDVVDAETDFEHIITFLDESSSGLHRKFASALRRVFEEVLRKRLDDIQSEQGRIPDDLYRVLIDMYSVPDFPEQLRGFLTLNYDGYLENALDRSGTRSCDRGIFLNDVKIGPNPVRTLKLHGSFDWDESWPVTLGRGDNTLWIPPGIQKAKEQYPFNLLWGYARELLDCDVLRVVGCRLGPNDWDLISLLFATRHINRSMEPYRVEIVDAPIQAARIQSEYPYLGVESILETEPIGSQLVAEFLGGAPLPFRMLATEQQKAVIANAGNDKNWFRLWLKQKAEITLRDLGSVATASGAFGEFLEAY